MNSERQSRKEDISKGILFSAISQHMVKPRILVIVGCGVFWGRPGMRLALQCYIWLSRQNSEFYHMPNFAACLHTSEHFLLITNSMLPLSVYDGATLFRRFPSLVPRPHLSRGKWSGEPGRISWAYYWNVVRTNEIAILSIIT